MSTPCDGNCACAEPCHACPSLPVYARLVPFRVPFDGADTPPNIAHGSPSRAGEQDPAAGSATDSTLAYSEGKP